MVVSLYQLRSFKNSQKAEVADVGSGRVVCNDCDNDGRVSFALVRLNLITAVQRISHTIIWFIARSPLCGRS